MSDQKFKGTWIPAEVWEMLKAGMLTPTEMVLLSLVDSLCSTKRGCFASNAYLAEKLSVSPKHITRMLSNLRELRLLRVELGDQRIITTRWSAVAQDLSPPGPESGISASAEGGSAPVRRGDQRQCGAENEDYNLDENESTTPQRRSRIDKQVGGFFGSGEVKKTNGNGGLDPKANDLAERILKAVKASGQPMQTFPRSSTIAKEIDRMLRRKTPPDELEAGVAYMEENYGEDQYCSKLYSKNNIVRALQSWRDQAKQGRSPKSNGYTVPDGLFDGMG